MSPSLILKFLNLAFINSLPRFVFKTIKNLEKLKSDEKLGVNLRNALVNLQESEYINVNIKFFEIKDIPYDEKVELFKSLIYNYKPKEFSYFNRTDIIRCSITKSSINQIIQSPLIKRINLPPKIVRTHQMSLETPKIFSESDISFLVDKSNDLPIV
ncbi:MAG: hypothetical protein ACFE96_05860, partial [Candidatus Hermodarchaeota archaeon]